MTLWSEGALLTLMTLLSEGEVRACSSGIIDVNVSKDEH